MFEVVFGDGLYDFIGWWYSFSLLEFWEKVLVFLDDEEVVVDLDICSISVVCDIGGILECFEVRFNVWEFCIFDVFLN